MNCLAYSALVAPPVVLSMSASGSHHARNGGRFGGMWSWTSGTLPPSPYMAKALSDSTSDARSNRAVAASA